MEGNNTSNHSNQLRKNRHLQRGRVWFVFKALPKQTLDLKDEKCTGGKHSKIRVTGLAAANMNGDKLPMFVIGKSQKPRCFENSKKLRCRYRGQKKSWMDSTLFEDWVRELENKFEKEKRKIALIIDNCTAHPEIGGLKAIDLFFLPPNTTSVLQPMDQCHMLLKSEVQNKSGPKNDRSN